jgi:3-ketosteroid 9alpha-monooxygenase subunit B
MSFRPLLVTGVVDETTSARSFYLRPSADDAERFRYRAGQNLLFRLEIDGEVIESPYSLSSAPETDPELQITVQEVEDGRASKWFHQAIGPGDEVLAGPPEGRFVLNGSSRPLMLLAAGSGITPVFSILKSALASTTRPISLLYANRSLERAIFKDAIDRLAERSEGRFEVRHHVDAEAGLITGEKIRAQFARQPDAEVYLCGPAPFMALVRQEAAALAIPPNRLITEDFDPPTPTPAAS